MTQSKDLLSDFVFEQPITDEAIAAFERNEGVTLPPDYRDFLRRGNGGEGPVGEFGYARFWRLDDLATLNKEYGVHDSLPDYLLIGSDGGGEAFAIKRRPSAGRYVQVPFIGLTEQDCMIMGDSFSEFLAHLSRLQ